MDETREKRRLEPMVHFQARTKIEIEHGPQGFAAEFNVAGQTVLVRGINAHEALSKAGLIIDDVAHVIRAYAEEGEDDGRESKDGAAPGTD